jgi:cytoskeletal protein CcmA (bactofilin family)
MALNTRDSSVENEHALFNSLVGEGTCFKGDITVNGILRIDGDFKGSIKTRGKVFIGRTGRAECQIEASSIVIGGIVSGTIISTEKVVVLSSAVVMGLIQAPRLVVEEGVLLNSELKISGGERVIPKPRERKNGSLFHRWMQGKEDASSQSNQPETVSSL